MAALGTAFSAAGNGMRVLILQFLKGSWHYGELDTPSCWERTVIRQMATRFCKGRRCGDGPEDGR